MKGHGPLSLVCLAQRSKIDQGSEIRDRRTRNSSSITLNAVERALPGDSETQGLSSISTETSGLAARVSPLPCQEEWCS